MAGVTDTCAYTERDLSLLWLFRDFENDQNVEKIDD